ncbi:MAG: Hsp20/alpha crystallin family protein [Myxococcota bacterium]
MLPVWRSASLLNTMPPAFSLLRAFEAASEPINARETIREEGDRYVLTVSVPGLKESDLALNVTAHTLVLKGERSLNVPEGYTALRRERTGLKLHRQLRFRRPLNPDAVEAILKDGVLTITLPKAAAAQSRRVTIHAAPTLEAPAIETPAEGAEE